MNAQVQTASSQQVALAQELEVLKPEVAKVLPQHVTADKFMRIVATAIAQSPDLRGADRASLFTSCVKCATDGLLPDGREAALVIFNSKVKTKELRDGKEITLERWIKKVQYMPMIGGILKKIRNSGELLSFGSNVVHEQDTFRYWIDDAGEHLTFEPNMQVPDRGRPTCAYAIAKTKDGGVYVEVMSVAQIEQVRSVSRAKDDGPWVSWWGEMARKTVSRRLSKRLPMSTDLEAVFHRDDELYDLNTPARNVTAKSGTAAAKQLLGLPVLPDSDDVAAAATQPTGEAGENVDESTGEVTEPERERGKPLPGFDEKKAVKLIRGAKSGKDLEDAADGIRTLLNGAEMPVAISAAIDEMAAKFADQP